MVKNLKLTYIFSIALASVVIAWKSISAFFGLGVCFIGLLIMLTGLLVIICTDADVKNKAFDLFIIATVFSALELVVFFVLEINSSNVTINAIKGFNAFQSFISTFGLIYFIYVVFRLITELKGIKVIFVQKLLGASKHKKRIKKAKEFTNGSLMEKPNANKKSQEISNFNSIDQTEVSVTSVQHTYSTSNDENSEN